MRTYPINFLLEGKPCVVVGGGEVASRKVKSLLNAGAVVTVVSPETCESIRALAGGGKIKWRREKWNADFAADAALIFIATDDEETNRVAMVDARSAGVPVNVADKPAECDFILPSVFRRGVITVAVGTGGASPALAAYLRRRLQQVVEPEYAMAAEILGKLRKVLEKAGVEPADRRRIFTGLVKAGLADKLRGKDRKGAESLLKSVVGEFVEVSELLGEER